MTDAKCGGCGYQYGGINGAGWKPGESGNPKGRPRACITERLRHIIDEAVEIADPSVPDGPKIQTTVAEAIARVAVQAVLDGDVAFFREIMNRVEGKVPDKVDAVVATGELSPEQERRLDAIMGRLERDGQPVREVM